MCAGVPALCPPAPESLPVVVVVVTAASLWATSVSEVLAEQPLENQLRLCYGNLVWTSLVFLLLPPPPSHPPVYLSLHLSFSPALLSHRWLVGDTSLALRDKPVFLVLLFTGRLLKGL